MYNYVPLLYDDLFTTYCVVPDCKVCEDLREIYDLWLRFAISNYDAVKMMILICETYETKRNFGAK